MTAETGKDVAEEPEVAEEAPARPAARPSRPARKKVRRVRVIEVIDDEDGDDDLEEVLQALDEEDAEADLEEERPEPEPAEAGTAKTTGTAGTAKTAGTKPKPAKAEEEDEDGDEEPEPKKKSVRPKPKPGREPARTSSFRDTSRLAAVAAIVVIAALATVTAVLWRSQAQLSAREDARNEVTEVVTGYGNIVLSYDRRNLRASVERAQSFLTGEALTKSRQTNVDQLQKSMDEGQFTLTSKTNQVYVGTVEGRFATAVLVFDITIASPATTQNVTRNYLSLSLVQENGTWKISQQKPAGRETDGAATGGTVPGLNQTPTPTPSTKD
ncbi:hypothetical protein [Thermomonospora cellulosilytica]|uniref:Mce-associated membrane protein n=1 Tax=Thermomonospora cellulosilytica TaxID=1411118 RepID=A0A7W3N516_9ACTN|nr:hypothetical protein [Thermomonospora cellulosilytica]MBA9007597.1 hypothetical protein [Thermomonospora cellulosilytica]